MSCESDCIGLTEVMISGPTELEPGETGIFGASIQPADTTAPVSLLWGNGDITRYTEYSWSDPGSHMVELTASNCDGTAVVTATLTVEVIQPIYLTWLPLVVRTAGP